jgi:hypothetical protein
VNKRRLERFDSLVSESEDDVQFSLYD